MSLQNAEELRGNILATFDERLRKATEVRVQTETALRNDLEKRMSALGEFPCALFPALLSLNIILPSAQRPIWVKE